MQDFTPFVQVAAIVGAATAALTLIKGLVEYGKQNALKRAEHFVKLRERLKGSDAFKAICDLLDQQDPRVADVPFKDKRDFLGLFEEVAIALNSGLIKPAVAQYMFGYYAIACWNDDNFWRDVNRNSVYWNVFRNFVDRMKVIESQMPLNPDKYTF